MLKLASQSVHDLIFNASCQYWKCEPINGFWNAAYTLPWLRLPSRMNARPMHQACSKPNRRRGRLTDQSSRIKNASA